MNWIKTGCITALAVAQTFNAISDDSQDSIRIFIGTYTGGSSKGIYTSVLNYKNGELTPPELASEITNPSFLAIHPSQKFLYVVNEIGDYQGKKTGAITGYSIDPATGMLTKINDTSSGGDGPCHLVISTNGSFVLAANYGGGSVVVAPIDAGGRLGDSRAFVQHRGSSVNPDRQKEPHAHSINLSPDQAFAFVADLGLDKVFSYKFDQVKGTLVENLEGAAYTIPGAGPRHFAFHPSGKFCFVINELNSTLTALKYAPAKGQLSALRSYSTYPDAPKDNSTAEVQVHPSGKFVYGSNRVGDTIAVFKFNESKGELELLENAPTLGKIPRNFGIDPSGKFLVAANQESDSVVVFEIDPDTGLLKPTGSKVSVGKPVCIKFLAR